MHDYLILKTSYVDSVIMEIVSKERWLRAIAAENEGWEFHNKMQYNQHEIGNLHGQIVCYAKYMQLFTDFGTYDAEFNKLNYSEKIFDMKGRSIIDLCGGPSSLLLRCCNFSRAVVVDPGNFPDYISNRYKQHNIEWIKIPAEEFVYDQDFDECLLYNALAHVYNPFLILLNAKKHCNTLRIIEGLYSGTNENHPQDLTQIGFEQTLNVKGMLVNTNDPAPAPRGIHWTCVIKQ